MTAEQQPGTPGTSSADPFVLQTYATDGMAMATALSEQATALAEAAEALAGAGASITGLDEVVSAVSDLAADWYHLDEFAGDVAAGFLAILGPGHTHDGSPLELTVDDETLDELGRIGFADRDEAIAEAEGLAGEYQAMLDAVANGEPLVWDPPRTRDGMSIETVERMSALLAASSDDPAFSVTFAESMGVNGMVGMRGMYEAYAHESRQVDRPRDNDWSDAAIDEWVGAQMVGAAAVLHTAMDTRRATATRTDAETDVLADEARLDEGWVERFERYGGDHQLDYSLLVIEADLPSDVLVAVGDAHLGDQFGHADRGSGDGSVLAPGPPTTTAADLNLAAAIAANPDASVGWLAGDGIDSGTATLELVLTSDVPGADMHGAFADIVVAGLTHPADHAGRAGLMEHAIRTVGAADATGVGSDAMREALGNGAAANMDVIHALITDEWPDASLNADPPADALIAHDFLRVVMADETTADVVAEGYAAYAIRQLDPEVLPAPGVDTDLRDLATDRADALQELGMLEGTILYAENNALIGEIEERIAQQEARGRVLGAGIDIVAYAGGIPAGVGPWVGAADTAADVSGLDPGAVVFPVDDAALEAAEQAADERVDVSEVNSAALMAIANDATTPPIDPTDGVSDEELDALKTWLRENHYDENAHAHYVVGIDKAERFEGRR